MFLDWSELWRLSQRLFKLVDRGAARQHGCKGHLGDKSKSQPKKKHRRCGVESCTFSVVGAPCIVSLPSVPWIGSGTVRTSDEDTYLAEKGDGLLVQSLRITNVASNNTLEWELYSFSELL